MKKPMFYSMVDGKSWSSQLKMRHTKFIYSCFLEENGYPLILKRNIKVARNLKLKSFNGGPNDVGKMSNTVNVLCKKRLGVKNVKAMYRAISTSRGKGAFFGFKMMKDLEMLNLDLILYPKRSKQDITWHRVLQYALNGSKRMKGLILTFRNSYCDSRELKQCFSRVIRLKSLQDLRLKISNPHINGNTLLKGISYLLGKAPHLQSFELKGGYSGLKVNSEAYLSTLISLYKLSGLKHLNLNFDIILKNKNLSVAQKDWQSRFFNKNIESLVLNIRIWDGVFEKASQFLSSLRELRRLEIRLIHKDQCITTTSYFEWADLIAAIVKMDNLEDLSIWYQYGRRIDCAQEKKDSIFDWINKRIGRICLRRNRKDEKTEQYSCVISMLLSIPHQVKSIKKFNLQFPSRICPSSSIISINKSQIDSV